MCTFGAVSAVPALLTGGPLGNGTGYACPSGTFCLAGASTPSPCTNGTYNPSPGQGSCLLCPASNSCPDGSVAPSPCPPTAYCPVGTVAGVTCPPGRWSPNASSNALPQDCALCPSGHYCLDGVVAGQCAAGHWCRAGQSSPTPLLDFGYPPSLSVSGGLCPVGSYCPLGALVPVACPNGTVLSTPGGTTAQSCLPCQAGEICYPGDPVGHPCPVGYYCPAGVPEPIPCPAGTYNTLLSQTGPAACLACPPGYECRDVSAQISSTRVA